MALVAAALTAFVLRDRSGADLTGPVLLVLLGDTCTVAALVTMVLAETRLDGLTLPERLEGAVAGRLGLPAPAWWAPLAAAGLVTMVVGGYVSAIILGLGLGLLGVAIVAGIIDTVTLLAVKRRRAVTDPAPLDRSTVRTARRIQAFARQHAAGESTAADAVVEHLGRYGAKVALVGADGWFSELVVHDVPRAELACELAGITVHAAFDRELTARMHSTPSDWSRMGGAAAVVPAWVEARTS